MSGQASSWAGGRNQLEVGHGLPHEWARTTAEKSSTRTVRRIRTDGSSIVRAQASDLPAGPIRVILPTLHGGQADTLGRLIGDRVGPAIERSFVMEPRAGAGGLIAGEYVARATPDGNTLLFVTGGHTTLPGLYKRTIKFDAVKDFAFVCQISEFELRDRGAHPITRRSRSPICWSVEEGSGQATRSAARVSARPST